MGCGTSREKVENEILKIQMKRSEVQMERANQIKLLEEIGGTYKSPSIPDYIDPENNNKNKRIPSSNNIKKQLKTDENPRRNKSHKNIKHFKKKKNSIKKDITN